MAALRDFYSKHPNIVMWIVLAIGMVAMLVYSSRDVGLLPQQLGALIVSTIGLAGLCVWIINWE
jgi:hypothetical protein